MQPTADQINAVRNLAKSRVLLLGQPPAARSPPALQALSRVPQGLTPLSPQQPTYYSQEPTYYSPEAQPSWNGAVTSYSEYDFPSHSSSPGQLLNQHAVSHPLNGCSLIMLLQMDQLASLLEADNTPETEPAAADTENAPSAAADFGSDLAAQHMFLEMQEKLLETETALATAEARVLELESPGTTAQVDPATKDCNALQRELDLTSAALARAEERIKELEEHNNNNNTQPSAVAASNDPAQPDGANPLASISPGTFTVNAHRLIDKQKLERAALLILGRVMMRWLSWEAKSALKVWNSSRIAGRYSEAYGEMSGAYVTPAHSHQ